MKTDSGDKNVGDIDTEFLPDPDDSGFSSVPLFKRAVSDPGFAMAAAIEEIDEKEKITKSPTTPTKKKSGQAHRMKNREKRMKKIMKSLRKLRQLFKVCSKISEKLSLTLFTFSAISTTNLWSKKPTSIIEEFRKR